ncbi:MAG: cytochrome c biogenesis protein CcsA [Sodaliphilus sp.]
MMRQPFTLILHIALVVIFAGAIVTHFCGIQGSLVLTQGNAPVNKFEKSDGPGTGRFPFKVMLQSAQVTYYPGTTTPMDFSSRLLVDGKPVSISMNRVAEIDGWRFCQSGISPNSSRLSISYDPWGTGITYIGYALLGIGMIGYFFQRRTLWHALLKEKKKVLSVLLLCAAAHAGAAEPATLPAMQRPLANNLGKVYVYWNDRVCPLQTMARDVTLKLYGSTSHEGLTAEQVLSGWLFYFDAWKRDFNDLQPNDSTALSDKAKKKLHEQLALIHWLGTGEAFKIYPYHSASGTMQWLSLTGRRPSKMSLEQWEMMQTTMPRMKQLLLCGQNIEANDVISELIENQIKYAGKEHLPSARKMQAERFYNRFANLLIPALLSLFIGAIYLLLTIRGKEVRKALWRCANTAVALVLLYLLCILALFWWIGNHVPLSNGPEMMLFMGTFSLICALISSNRWVKGALLIVAAMTLFVGVMAGRTPRIGMLMPVLLSPLLSVHVMLVMTSYVFFLLMAILAAIGLSIHHPEKEEALCRINRSILLPAVFLLAGGIFLGAVWANQSWGRYWGWDPKETCALVMLLIYALPLHWGSRWLKCFRKPKVLHWYLLGAILSVLFTYFGANYFLSGLHSYA